MLTEHLQILAGSLTPNHSRPYYKLQILIAMIVDKLADKLDIGTQINLLSLDLVADV